MQVDIRKIVRFYEETRIEAGRPVSPPTRKVATAAVIVNPLAGSFGDDLRLLVNAGEELGALLTREALAALDADGSEVSAYGKGAIVGTDGALEHAAAILHPRFGKGVRGFVGPGAAIMSSAKKIGGPGSGLLVPLANKEDIWSAADFDAVEVAVPDAPRADEILIALGLAIGGRPGHRITMS
ncbi:MAG: amino acid synthesis family protein [Comamonadaceae bacterium]|nr:MAG: amino acid synthesis family protein [Comamonadaceae bacterium]